MATGHGKVEQKNFGLQFANEIDGFKAIAGFPNHLESALGLKQTSQAIPENGVIVRDQD